jgi:hypothetical protein
MVPRDVQRLEVVPLVLDLRALRDAIPHAGEHVDDLRLHDRERVQGAGARPPTGERDVHLVVAQERVLRRALEGPTAFLERRLEFRLHLVREPTEIAPCVGIEPADGALDLGPPRPAAQQRHLGLLDLPERRRGPDPLQAALQLALEDASGVGGVHGAGSLASDLSRTAYETASGDGTSSTNRTPSSISTVAVPP